MFSEITEICNHSFLTRLIDSKSMVVDLGANKGEFAHEMIRRFGCRVVAAEPVKELYDKIERHPLLELLPIAAGGENQRVEMNIFRERCASVLRPESLPEGTISQPIEMVTLGELFQRGHIKHVDLLKIDIEGAEIDLFNSSSDDELQSVMQLSIEFHEFIFPEQSESIAKFCDRMRRIGFWVLPFSLDNTNVLFINKKTGVALAEIVYLKSIVKYGKGLARRSRRMLAK